MADDDSDLEFGEGDRVVLEDTHHAHNSGLKALEGRAGTIVTLPSGFRDQYLVEFDGQTRKLSGRYWVTDKWLRLEDDDDNG